MVVSVSLLARPFGARVLHAILHFPEGVARACSGWGRAAYDQTLAIERLSSYSDAALADIGLTRDEVEAAVRNGMPRRPW